nr:hypothetical protein [Tanacetum cinerariifolium]
MGLILGCVSVPGAPSIAADVSVSAVSTTTADVSAAPALPAELPIQTSGSVGVLTGVTEATTTSIPDPPLPTTPTEIPYTTSPRESLGASTHGVESQEDASESDGDPSPYAPYAGWEMRQEPETFALILWGGFAPTMERMLRHGLEVPKLLVGGDLTMAEQFVCFIKADLLNA